MGRSELIFHGFYRFPEFLGIRATGFKFVQKVSDFGFSHSLSAFISALTKSKPVGWSLGGASVQSWENQGLKRSMILNFMSGARLLMSWVKVDLKKDQAASMEVKVFILS